MFYKGIKFTEEHKQKLKEARKKYLLNNSVWNKGLIGEEYKKHFENGMKGCFKKGSIAYWKGKKLSEEHCLNLSLSRKGKHCNPKYEFKKGHNAGEKSHLWKGGISSLHEQIRKLDEYKSWRKKVWKRDGYKCVKCSSNKKIQAHHNKISFSKLLLNFVKKYNQFSPIEDKETLVRLAITYKPFWDLNNGITLCKECHWQQGKHKGKIFWVTDKKLNYPSPILQGM